MKKMLIILITVLFLLIIVTSELINKGYIWFVYPGKSKYPVRGIDVSHHQGDIDWDKVKNSNFKFVFIKATEGHDFVDEDFIDNWNNSKEIGLIRGAYHFYSLRIQGKEQAENFIKNVPKEKDMLPPVIDLEFGGNSRMRPLKNEFKKELLSYINEVENYYNKKPIFYTTYTFFKAYLKDDEDLLKYDIWIRNIYYKPRMFGNKKWLFWQYNSRGRVAGIKGFVDLNVFAYNDEQFEKLLKE
ncbi:MAG: glycoside hydrolase family 25 protein [Fusobacteriaceae bacterium]|nr:glycoside hydrolase family 25 protein [Fusobacteriaceae bacterium]